MKFTLLSCLIMVFALSLHAQSPDLPKRYATVELFTNTPCPSCVAQNPGFFDLLDDYQDDVHLISFYPGQPYSSCPLYQDNVSENEFRTTYRNISSTPRVWMNGDVNKNSGSINEYDMDRVTGDQSFLAVEVVESGSVMVTANVRLKTFDTPPFSTGRLFVAIVEKDVTLTGIPSSWEEHHFSVFRKFQSPQEGIIVDLTINDQTINFEYLNNPDWDLDKIHLLAWVEHPESKIVWNSGTRFDPFVGSIDISKQVSVEVFPNPATNVVNVELPEDFNLDKIEVTDIAGRSVLISKDANQIDVSSLSKGKYFLMIWGVDNAHVVSQFIKD